MACIQLTFVLSLTRLIKAFFNSLLFLFCLLKLRTNKL
uniref:Uncharacterized protein n=1 Tax=Anguilla anguilla TaxID=7936 RepID=A0A0E9WE79_ANGAN